jgi:hydrogenase maturation protease
MLSVQPPPGVAPVLVLATGNPGRGDDALGPRAAQRLAALGLPGVEVLTDFQLQVEHALDLLGRELVVFIDAAVGGDAAYELTPIAPAADARHSSHSLSPAAVLDVCFRLTGIDPPQSRLLAIRGYDFELGAPLSDEAAANLEAGLAAVVPMLRRRARCAGRQAAPA